MQFDLALSGATLLTNDPAQPVIKDGVVGIKGNSHMVMMDKNSDAVAALIQKWLAERGLVEN